MEDYAKQGYNREEIRTEITKIIPPILNTAAARLKQDIVDTINRIISLDYDYHVIGTIGIGSTKLAQREIRSFIDNAIAIRNKYAEIEYTLSPDTNAGDKAFFEKITGVNRVNATSDQKTNFETIIDSFDKKHGDYEERQKAAYNDSSKMIKRINDLAKRQSQAIPNQLKPLIMSNKNVVITNNNSGQTLVIEPKEFIVGAWQQQQQQQPQEVDRKVQQNLGASALDQFRKTHEKNERMKYLAQQQNARRMHEYELSSPNGSYAEKSSLKQQQQSQQMQLRNQGYAVQDAQSQNQLNQQLGGNNQQEKPNWYIQTPHPSLWDDTSSSQKKSNRGFAVKQEYVPQSSNQYNQIGSYDPNQYQRQQNQFNVKQEDGQKQESYQGQNFDNKNKRKPGQAGINQSFGRNEKQFANDKRNNNNNQGGGFNRQ